MKTYFYLTLIFQFFYGSISRANDVNMDNANIFIKLINEQKFSEALKYTDDNVQKSLPPEKLKEVWQSILTSMGSLKEYKPAVRKMIEQEEAYFVKCLFEKDVLALKMFFNSRKKISGFWFVPISQMEPKWVAPAYGKKDAFTEQDLKLSNKEWSLPGTLSIPNGPGPFPLLILVHGSGPNDRDETLASNKPFKDLAWGLASLGVAVYRYDKRTLVHGREFAKIKYFTVFDEVIDDVVAAAHMFIAGNITKISRQKVFILGHSLGGELIPKISKVVDKNIAGFVIMAGPSKEREELILEQMEYIYLLDRKMSKEETEDLNNMRKKVARASDPTLTKDSPKEELPFGVSASYILSLRGYDAAEEAKTITKPLMIIQGEKDYQVTVKEFNRWKAVLAGKRNVSFKLYPKLDHGFIEIKGKSTPDDYNKPSNVPLYVIENLVKWIKSI